MKLKRQPQLPSPVSWVHSVVWKVDHRWKPYIGEWSWQDVEELWNKVRVVDSEPSARIPRMPPGRMTISMVEWFKENNIRLARCSQPDKKRRGPKPGKGKNKEANGKEHGAKAGKRKAVCMVRLFFVWWVGHLRINGCSFV